MLPLDVLRFWSSGVKRGVASQLVIRWRRHLDGGKAQIPDDGEAAKLRQG